MGQASIDDIVSNQGPVAASAAPAGGTAHIDDIVSNQGPAPGTTGIAGFANKIGEGAAESAHDIYGAAKGAVKNIAGLATPGSPEQQDALKTVWNSLPPVPLADAVKQTLPLIHAYEQARAKGAPISDALTAVNEAAKQHTANIAQLTPMVEAFKANPTRETARAVLDATAAAASLLVGGEAAAPEAEAAAVAPAAAPVVAAPAEESLMTRLTNPFKKFLTTPKDAGAAATQAPTEAAVRALPNIDATAPIVSRSAGTTAADDMLAKAGIRKDVEYKRIDDVAGFDLKAERQKLSDTQYAIKQPGADVPKLQAEIDQSTDRIADANSRLRTSGIDPKVADNLNAAWEATKSFKNDLVRATKADGTIDVNALLKRANSRFNQRYGDRLAQAFGQGDVQTGKVIAENYIKGLEAAQKAGQTALKAQRFKLWLGGLAGVAAIGEGGKAGLTALLAP